MDLKQFLEKNKMEQTSWTNVYGGSYEPNGKYYLMLEDLGLFFWERGGKEYCEILKGLSFEKLIECARINVEKKMCDFGSRDFLDALACLGEEKIKELIKELWAKP